MKRAEAAGIDLIGSNPGPANIAMGLSTLEEKSHMVLFTTGPGNSFVSLLAPTVKLSANAVACRELTEQIDFDASGILTGETTFDDATKALLEQMMDVASGAYTFGEILGEGDETISRNGETL